MGYETIDELDAALLPRNEDDLLIFVDAYKNAAESLDNVENDIIELEEKLNDVVYTLYDLNNETREYIEKNVKTPTTPVRPKAMSE